MSKYEPILRKIESWIWYEENQPKTNDFRVKNEFRSKYDLDCVLNDGNLYADTIFSLWLPLRAALVDNNGYLTLNKIGNINRRHEFLKKIVCEDILSTLLPYNETTDLLIELFYLGQMKVNTMILPDRKLQIKGKECFDYMPWFLLECFDGGKYNFAFKRISVEDWIENQKMNAFFMGNIISRENIKDLAETGNLRDNKTKDLSVLFSNYILILKERLSIMSDGVKCIK